MPQAFTLVVPFRAYLYSYENRCLGCLVLMVKAYLFSGITHNFEPKFSKSPIYEIGLKLHLVFVLSI